MGTTAKIAIFHDYFGAFGGAERLVTAMAKILNADIITTDTDAVQRIDPSVRVVSLGKAAPFPALKQISASLLFYFCDFSTKYDFFIFSGNWSHFAAHRHHPNVWYCNTPTRAFYSPYLNGIIKQNIVKRLITHIWVAIHRCYDRRSVKNIDIIVSNSENIRNKVKLFYNRDSTVIYPGIDVSRFQCGEHGNYWLSVNRVYPEKRIELQINAFRLLPDQHLLIAGGYASGDCASAYFKQITRDLPPNVTLLGEISEEKLIDLYAHCKGLLCTAVDEDFGLTPLEAMASGKPVVAPDEGGFKETITSRTGIRVPSTTQDFVGALKQIGKDPSAYKNDCLLRANDFDIAKFSKRLKEIVCEYATNAKG
jgi:glycosyltransferase involved in cell wall biosynthesis